MFDNKRSSLLSCGSNLSTFVLLLLLLLTLLLLISLLLFLLLRHDLLFFFITDQLLKDWSDLVGPFELAPTYSCVIKSHDGFRFSHLSSDFCNFLVSWREMREDGAPDSTVNTDLKCLTSSSMHFLSCIFFHAVLKSSFMDQYSGSFCIISQICARDCVSRVENVSILRTDYQSTVCFHTVIDFAQGKLFKAIFG